MKRAQWLLAAALGVAVIGCESKQSSGTSSTGSGSSGSSGSGSATATPSGSATPNESAATPAAQTQSPATQPTAGGVAAAKTDMQNAANTAVGNATATNAPQPTDTTGGSAPTTQPADQAQAQIQQVFQYIKDNKLDLADKTLSQLEQNKASLPVSVQKQLPQARQMLNTAKAGGGIKLPGQ